MFKKLTAIGVAAAILAASAVPAFAVANTNASCIGLDVSVEGPEGTVSSEVQAFLDFAKDEGIPLGSLVKGEAQAHDPNCTPE